MIYFYVSVFFVVIHAFDTPLVRDQIWTKCIECTRTDPSCPHGAWFVRAFTLFYVYSQTKNYLVSFRHVSIFVISLIWDIRQLHRRQRIRINQVDCCSYVV